MNARLRTLLEIAPDDVPECGSKAVWLGQLASRGYLVPPGLVIPTAVYRECLESNGLTEAARAWAEESLTASAPRLVEIEREAGARFAKAALPDAVCTAISAWTRQYGGGLLAVRSSATREDLAHASFAGQYDSFLNVLSADVRSAISRCFAGLFNARAAMYRRRKHIAEIGQMAVLLQRMVPAEHAGVVFTTAPHDSALLLLECAPGLGDRVVSGAVTPNQYYFQRSTLELQRAVEVHTVARESVRSVARVALAIERCLGRAQDVEYGVVGDQIMILQARPVTRVA